jgi:cysteine desulfurase/selenocysteine lyase
MYTHGLLEPGDEILLTEAEHHSNIGPWLIAAEQTGAKVRAAPVLPNGDLDLDALDSMLTARTRLLSVTHVSNATGGINPVKRITRMAHAKGITVMVDGAQAVPHMPVDVRDIGCEFYSGSGHKLGGPSSVGFLYGRADVMEKMPLADAGSTMSEHMTFEKIEAKPIPHKYEAGEPAFGEVEAWSLAIDYWRAIGLDRIAAYEKKLTEYARDLLGRIPRVKLLGDPAERISIVSFTIDGMKPGDIEKALDQEGIAVRAGNLEAEPLLKKLGTDEAVRASFMFYNHEGEIERFAAVLRAIAA